MEWVEVSVAVENEAAEAVAEVLSRYAYHGGVALETGAEGWGSAPVTVRAYLLSDETLAENRRHIETALGHLNQIMPVPPPTFQYIQEQDWTETWKERLTVLHVGRRIVIQPSWREYAPTPEEVVIRLDPGLAFGTGLHPTTQMCLMALEERLRPGMRVLDMGTGSGILAITAAKLGAGRVWAVDDDPVAVEVARENVWRNGVSDLVEVVGGSLAQATGSYDLVLVNILVRVIVEMIEAGLATRLVEGGKLVLTGLITGQDVEVMAAMERYGLTLVDRRQEGDWVCLTATRG